MEKQEYISVSEFATRLQTSKQYVYQLIKGKLKDYTITERGKKLLRVDALDMVRDGIKVQPSEAPGGHSRESELTQQLLDEKDRIISMLREQLQEANKNVTMLQQLLAAQEARRQLEAPKRKGLFSWFRKSSD